MRRARATASGSRPSFKIRFSYFGETLFFNPLYVLCRLGRFKLRASFCLGVVVLALLAGCGSKPNRGESEQPTTSGAEFERPVLWLEAVDFDGDLDVVRVKSECSMLEKLTGSILASVNNYEVNIKALNKEERPEDYFSLEVTYVNVIPHRWVFPSIRPSSSATVKAQIKKNGEVWYTTSKPINSGMALGACDRLEKIAVAGGRYVAKWASTQILY